MVAVVGVVAEVTPGTEVDTPVVERDVAIDGIDVGELKTLVVAVAVYKEKRKCLCHTLYIWLSRMCYPNKLAYTRKHIENRVFASIRCPGKVERVK